MLSTLLPRSIRPGDPFVTAGLEVKRLPSSFAQKNDSSILQCTCVAQAAREASFAGSGRHGNSFRVPTVMKEGQVYRTSGFVPAAGEDDIAMFT